MRFEAFYTLDARPADVSGPVADVAPAGADYELPDAPIGERAFFRDAEKAIKRQVVAERTLELRRNVQAQARLPSGRVGGGVRRALRRGGAGRPRTPRRPSSVTGWRRARTGWNARWRRRADGSRTSPWRSARSRPTSSPRARGCCSARCSAGAGAHGRWPARWAGRRAARASAARRRRRWPTRPTTCSRSNGTSRPRSWRSTRAGAPSRDQIEPVAVRAEAADVAVERLALIWATPL